MLLHPNSISHGRQAVCHMMSGTNPTGGKVLLVLRPLDQPIGDATLETIMSPSPLISRPRHCATLVASVESKLEYQDSTERQTQHAV